MIGVSREVMHSANTATTAMRDLPYLRRPAARKIESSPAVGISFSFNQSCTFWHNLALGSVDGLGISVG